MSVNTAKKPVLTIIVIFYNMRREAERTLYTLSTKYQVDVDVDEYQVVAIDNGSDQALDCDQVKAFGPNFKYHFFETESVSPASAINFGANAANSDYIAVIVDGARMITPGLVRESMRALRTLPNPFVCSLGWHLGPDVQNLTILDGYNQAEEDRLLDSIDWRRSGYRLFEISTLAQSSGTGFLGGMPSECSWFAMPRSDFIGMGGYDERFQSPGGGQVNHDFLNRVLSRSEVCAAIILGEGSFHQIHGGVASNVPLDQHPAEMFKAEYLRIHAKPLERVRSVLPFYTGEMPDAALKFIKRAKPVLNGDEEQATVMQPKLSRTRKVVRKITSLAVSGFKSSNGGG